jgi:hypothetical protein
MSVERERITRSKANRKIVAAAKQWLQPLGFTSVGGSSECVFERWEGDRYQSLVIGALSYVAVHLRVFGRTGFVSAEKIFRHFARGQLLNEGSDRQSAFGFSIDYVQLTRDDSKAHLIWTYADEEAEVLQRLKDVLMDFVYATIEQIKTPDELIDSQVAKIDDPDKFAIGVPDDTDGALRLLTLIRLYRPAMYADVRPRLQKALEKWGPLNERAERHLAYLEQPDPLPPLPDRSAWAAPPTT